MKIKIKADIIVTIPDLNPEESIIDLLLRIEQELNKVGITYVPKTNTNVGVRVHLTDTWEIEK